MDKITITLNVSLKELHALYWLMFNMRHIIDLSMADKRETYNQIFNFLGSQETNLRELKDVYENLERLDKGGL